MTSINPSWKLWKSNLIPLMNLNQSTIVAQIRIFLRKSSQKSSPWNRPKPKCLIQERPSPDAPNVLASSFNDSSQLLIAPSLSRSTAAVNTKCHPVTAIPSPNRKIHLMHPEENEDQSVTSSSLTMS